jgi:hypothetical protein
MGLVRAITLELIAVVKEIWDGLIALLIWLVQPWRWPGTLWLWGRVLWVCRVPAVSAVGGGALLAFTPQARDCFSDLGLLIWQWGLFLLLTLVWAWTVHGTGRRALQADDWVPDAHCGNGLADGRRNELRVAYGLPALLVPRLLGLSVFGFVIIALWRARTNLTAAQAGLTEADEAVRQIDWLFAAVIVLTVLYCLWVQTRRRVRMAMAGLPLAEEPTLLTGALPVPLSLWAPNGQAIGAPILRNIEWVRTLVVAGITGFFVYSFVSPHGAADLLPRVLVVPVLFGGFVLALGEVAMWSMRLSTPFLFLLTLLSGVFLFFAEHFHDIRFVNAAAPPSAMRGADPQIHFAEAVARWRRANNNCNPDAAVPARKCPRPILIAGAGGASRAAFMTATVVGALIDLGREHPDTYGNVRNRIFAMSTVSGSSLGAVVMRAAFADAGDSGAADQPPCAQGTGRAAWFRHRTNADTGDPRYGAYKTSWRDCFQLLLSGDFLSPVMLGLFYRDSFPIEIPPGRPWWGDRAELLEQAFERRYAQVIGGDRTVCAGAFDRGLCRPFGYHPAPGDGGVWVPLLFINGTSVWTGRRIIAADIPMGDCGGKTTPALLPFAYDVREYLNPPPKLADCPPPQHGDAAKGIVNIVVVAGDDIRLSTAATVSARFPIVSPQGNFRDQRGDRADEVVDGGYFENDGLATIGDVAAALKQYDLDPVVVRITNEPAETATKADNARPPRAVDVGDRTLFDDFISIARTLVSTRAGQLDGHEAYVKSIITNETRLIRVGVYEQLEIADMPTPDNPLCRWEPYSSQPPGMKNVSMSWWMSHPVQAYIDAQLCKRENWKNLLCELRNGKAGVKVEENCWMTTSQ